jgi:hypothetical protein
MSEFISIISSSKLTIQEFTAFVGSFGGIVNIAEHTRQVGRLSKGNLHVWIF